MLVFGLVLTVGLAWWAGVAIGERLSSSDKEKHFQQQRELTKTVIQQNQSISIGEKWPDPLLQDLDGNWRKVSEIVKDTVLLIIIEPGCDACEAEFDAFDDLLSKESVAEKVIIISDAYPLDLVQVRQARQIKCPILVDRSREVFQQFNLIVFPTNIIIGPDRKIISVTAGPLSRDQIDKMMH